MAVVILKTNELPHIRYFDCAPYESDITIDILEGVSTVRLMTAVPTALLAGISTALNMTANKNYCLQSVMHMMFRNTLHIIYDAISF